MRILWIVLIAVCVLAVGSFAFVQASSDAVAKSPSEGVTFVNDGHSSWNVAGPGQWWSVISVGGVRKFGAGEVEILSADAVIYFGAVTAIVTAYAENQVPDMELELPEDNFWVKKAVEFADNLAKEKPGDKEVAHVRDLFRSGRGTLQIRRGEECWQTGQGSVMLNRCDGEKAFNLHFGREKDGAKLSITYAEVKGETGELKRVVLREKDGDWEFGFGMEPNETDKAEALALLDEAMERYPWLDW